MVNKKITYILGVLVLCGWAGTTNALVVGGPGNSNNCFPFGCPSGWPPVYQQVYNSSEFTGQISISSLSFYQNADFPDDVEPAQGTYTIQLSTTSASADGLSSVTANNLGADNATVYTGALPAAPATGGQWDIPLDSVFSYDPAQGNLLLTVTATSPTNTTSLDLVLVSRADNADGISRVFGSGITSSQGLVTGFNEAALPPPAPPGTSPQQIPVMSAYALVLTMLSVLFVAGRRLRGMARQR